MLRSRAVPLVVVAALALAACSGDDPGDPETPSGAGSGSSSPITDASLPSGPPPDAFEEAQAGLRDAGTARWELTVVNASGGPVVTESGYVRIDPPASLSLRLAPAERPRELTTISQQTDLWFQDGTDTDLQGCWAHRGLDPQSPTSDLVPPSIQILLARGIQETGSDATSVDATVPLLEAAEPFGETVQQMLLNLDRGYGNVPVRFTVEDGALTGYRVALDDVLAVAEAAGVEPFPGMAELGLVAELRLVEVGQPVELAPPVPDEVVELGPRESVAKGLGRCGRV